MTGPSLRVVPPGAGRDAYLPLLHLADDSIEQVQGYYQSGTLYGLVDGDRPIAMILAVDGPDGPDGAVELKAVAVDAALHDQGIGTRMLRKVLDRLRLDGIRRVVVGTGNCGIGQLAFYQKAGFRLWRIERDYFTPHRGYPDNLEENGIPLRDMVWLDHPLP